jgi:hypothetical protein
MERLLDLWMLLSRSSLAGKQLFRIPRRAGMHYLYDLDLGNVLKPFHKLFPPPTSIQSHPRHSGLYRHHPSGAEPR